MVTIPFAGNAQTDETEFFMGINGGLDYNMNAYKLDKNESYGYAYYGISPRYNIGLDFGLKVSKKLRPRIEIKYVNVKYGIDWSPSVYQFGTTVTNVNYVDFNLHLDYLLISIKKFQLFVSPAVKSELEMRHSISSTNWNILELKHPGKILGGAVSAIIKYNLSKNFGITLTPEYTMFLKPFATGNDKPYQRFSSNIGIEYKFGD